MTRNKTHDPATLERLFGSSTATRILDFLTLFYDCDYSKMDIAKNSDISFRHALKEIGKLEELGLIKKTRTIGRAQMYKLNTENPATQLLRKFKIELACREGLKIAEAEIAKEEQAKPPKAETIPA
ncbi:hypothetical protein MUP42_00940 [Candidatus Bathyarchaeota archaeon]|jgi:DNA-binding transcriptional ArsR family regulator|nr:hypothetical protein [Candidatus Bathyarchaeota archaeon]